MDNKLSFAIGLGALLLALQSHASETTNLSPNAGFETSSVANGVFQYASNEQFSAPNWIFSGSTGIANHSNAWGGEASANALAFLQGDEGSLSQIVTSDAKTYKIAFDTAQRGSYGQGEVQVYWDNILLASLTPSSSSYERHEFVTQGLPTLIHTLTFRQVIAGDVSVYIDNVEIIANPVTNIVVDNFDGIFDVSQWAAGSNAPTNLVDTSNAPTSVTLSNYAAWSVSGSTFTYNSAPSNGTVTFNYTVTNSTNTCPAGYVHNGVTTMLPEGTGTATFDVISGAPFGFALNGQNIASDFGCSSNGTLVTFEVSNFSFVGHN